MTDVRATEQILERIGKQAQALFALGEDGGARADIALSIVHDAAELRRRGDTLVRRQDLRLLVEAREDGPIVVTDREAIHAALGSLEAALNSDGSTPPLAQVPVVKAGGHPHNSKASRSASTPQRAYAAWWMRHTGTSLAR